MHDRHSTFSPCSRTFQILVGATTATPSWSNIPRIVAGVLVCSSEAPWRFSYTLERPAWMFGSAPADEETAARPRASALTRNRFFTFVMASSDFLCSVLRPGDRVVGEGHELRVLPRVELAAHVDGSNELDDFLARHAVRESVVG